MLRAILKPDNQNVLLKVPEDFVGKQVEIIAFTIDETEVRAAVTEGILTHYASDKILSKDWLTHDEDIAWQSL